jgi:uncharacterized repeat protein (TIGR03847 family)
MSDSFDLTQPDLFTAGTVGPPGQRTFYLQARQRDVLVTLKVEKEQVGALGEYLATLLAKLPTPAEVVTGDLALVEPIAPAWAARSIGVGYDEALDRVVIIAQEMTDDDERADEDEPAEDEEPTGEGEPSDDEPTGTGASARFHVSPAQASAFVERARGLVKAGRPPCAICGRPLNPGGHVCPRSNGHGRD